MQRKFNRGPQKEESQNFEGEKGTYYKEGYNSTGFSSTGGMLDSYPKSDMDQQSQLKRRFDGRPETSYSHVRPVSQQRSEKLSIQSEVGQINRMELSLALNNIQKRILSCQNTMNQSDFVIFVYKLLRALVIESENQISKNYPEKAQIILVRCQQWASKSLDQFTELTILINIHYAIYHTYIEEYDRGFYFLKQAYSLLKSFKDYYLTGLLYLNQSKLYYATNNIDSAMSSARQSLGILLLFFNFKKSQITKDPQQFREVVRYIGQAFNQVAILLDQQNNHVMSMIFHEQAYHFCQETLGERNEHTIGYRQIKTEYSKANYSQITMSNQTSAFPNGRSLEGIYWKFLMDENIFINTFKEDDYSKMEQYNLLPDVYTLIGVNYNFFRKLNISSKNQISNFNVRPDKYVPPKDQNQMNQEEVERLERLLEEQRVQSEEEKKRTIKDYQNLLERERLNLIREFDRLYNEKLTKESQEQFDDKIETYMRENKYSTNVSSGGGGSGSSGASKSLDIHIKFDMLLQFIRLKTEIEIISSLPPPQIITPALRVITPLIKKKIQSTSMDKDQKHHSWVDGYHQVQLDISTTTLIIAFSKVEEVQENIHKFWQLLLNIDSLRALYEDPEKLDKYLRDTFLPRIESFVRLNNEEGVLVLDQPLAAHNLNPNAEIQPKDTVAYCEKVPGEEENGIRIEFVPTSINGVLVLTKVVPCNLVWVELHNKKIAQSVSFPEKDIFYAYSLDDLNQDRFGRGVLAVYQKRFNTNLLLVLTYTERDDMGYEQIITNSIFADAIEMELDKFIIQSLINHILATVSVAKDIIRFDQKNWNEERTKKHENAYHVFKEKFYLDTTESGEYKVDFKSELVRIFPTSSGNRNGGGKADLKNICNILADSSRIYENREQISKWRDSWIEQRNQKYILDRDYCKEVKHEGSTLFFSTTCYIDNTSERAIELTQLQDLSNSSGNQQSKRTGSKRIYTRKNFPTPIAYAIMGSQSPISYFQGALSALTVDAKKFRSLIWEKTIMQFYKEKKTKVITSWKYQCKLYKQEYSDFFGLQQNFFLAATGFEVNTSNSVIYDEKGVSTWIADFICNDQYPCPLLFFYFNNQNKQISDRFARCALDLKEESAPPYYLTFNRIHINLLGYDIFLEKLSRIVKFWRKLSTKRKSRIEIEIIGQPQYSLSKVRQFNIKKIDPKQNTEIDWPCLIVVMFFPRLHTYKAQFIELQNILGESRNIRNYDLVIMQLKYIQKKKFNFCVEELFMIDTQKHKFDLKVIDKRKTWSSKPVACFPVNTFRVAPVTKSDFEVQCEIKIPPQKKDKSIGAESLDFLLPEYGENSRSIGTQCEEDRKYAPRPDQQDENKEEYIFMRTFPVRHSGKIIEIESFYSRTKRELVFRYKGLKESSIEVPDGVHPKYYINQLRVYLFNFKQGASSAKGGQPQGVGRSQARFSGDYQLSHSKSSTRIQSLRGAESSLLGGRNSSISQSTQRLKTCVNASSRHALSKSISPATVDVGNALADNEICVYTPEQEDNVRRIQRQFFFNRYLYETLGETLNFGKYTCQLQIGYRYQVNTLFVSLICLPQENLRNLYQFREMTRRRFVLGLEKYVFPNIQFDRVKGFVFDNQNFLIPDGVMDELDFEQEQIQYGAVYDPGPLAGEIQKIMKKIFVDYEEIERIIIPNIVSRAYALNQPDQSSQRVISLADDIGISDIILSFDVSFKMELRSRDTTYTNAIFFQLGNNQRRCFVLSMIKQSTDQDSSRFKLRFRVGGKEEEIETNDIAWNEMYQFRLTGCFRDYFVREYEVKLFVNQKLEGMYSSTTPVEFPIKDDYLFLGTNRTNDYLIGCIYNLAFRYRNNKLKTIEQPRVKRVMSSSWIPDLDSLDLNASTLASSMGIGGGGDFQSTRYGDLSNKYQSLSLSQNLGGSIMNSPEKTQQGRPARPESATVRSNFKISKNLSTSSISTGNGNFMTGNRGSMQNLNNSSAATVLKKTAGVVSGSRNAPVELTLEDLLQDRKTREKYGKIGENFNDILQVLLAISPRVNKSFEEDIRSGKVQEPPVKCLVSDLLYLKEMEGRGDRYVYPGADSTSYYWYVFEDNSSEFYEQKIRYIREATVGGQTPLPVKQFMESQVNPFFLIEFERFANILLRIDSLQNTIDIDDIRRLAHASQLTKHFRAVQLYQSGEKLDQSRGKLTFEEVPVLESIVVDYLSFLKICRDQLPPEKVKWIKKKSSEEYSQFSESRKTKRSKSDRKGEKAINFQEYIGDFEDSQFESNMDDAENADHSSYYQKKGLQKKSGTDSKVEKVGDYSQMTNERVLTYNSLEDLKEILVTQKKVQLTPEELRRWILVEIDFVQYGLSNQLIKEQIELLAALQRDNIIDVVQYCRNNNIQPELGLDYPNFRRLLNELRIGKNEQSNQLLFRIIAGSGADAIPLQRLHHFIHDFFIEATYIQFINGTRQIEDVIQTSMYEYGGFKSRQNAGINYSISSMGSGLSSNLFPVIYTNSCILKSSGHTFSEINLHKVKNQCNFQPYFMWPIVKVESDFDIVSYHTYENLDNQFEKSVVKVLKSFGLKGDHPTMILHGLEVQFRFVKEEFTSRIEYLSINPAFGRTFPNLPLKNNRAAKQMLVEDFEGLVKSYGPREIATALQFSKIVRVGQSRDEIDLERLSFLEFIRFLRQISEFRYSKQGAYQIFKTFKDEEILEETQEGSQLLQEFMYTSDIFHFVLESSQSSTEQLPHPQPDWKDARFELQMVLNFPTSSDVKRVLEEATVRMCEILFTNYFSNSSLYLVNLPAEEKQSSYYFLEVLISRIAHQHFSEIQKNYIQLHGIENPDAFINSPEREACRLFDNLALLILTRKSEVQIEEEQNRVANVDEATLEKYQNFKIRVINASSNNNRDRGGGDGGSVKETKGQKKQINNPAYLQRDAFGSKKNTYEDQQIDDDEAVLYNQQNPSTQNRPTNFKFAVNQEFNQNSEVEPSTQKQIFRPAQKKSTLN